MKVKFTNLKADEKIKLIQEYLKTEDGKNGIPLPSNYSCKTSTKDKRDTNKIFSICMKDETFKKFVIKEI